MRHVYAAGLAILALGSVAGAVEPANRMRCEEQRANRACEIRESHMSAGGRLDVDAAPNGGIHVTAWDKKEILVRAKVEAWGDSKSEAESTLAQVKVIAENQKVRTTGPKESGHHSWGWSASYEIFVPARIDLGMETVNGGINVDGVSGAMKFETVNGGVHLAGVAGRIKGQTVNGGVHVELSGAKWDGEGLDVQTVNGGVTLALPGAYNANIRANTVHGGVSSDFSGAKITKGQWGAGPNTLELTVGSGGAPIKLETVNGGVSVKRREA
jgi:hypothetical protein